jgi:hypothetical protein
VPRERQVDDVDDWKAEDGALSGWRAFTAAKKELDLLAIMIGEIIPWHIASQCVEGGKIEEEGRYRIALVDVPLSSMFERDLDPRRCTCVAH